MSADSEWVVRCADRIGQTWGHLSEVEVRDTAAELFAMKKWREFAPEVAAVAWLRLVRRPHSSRGSPGAGGDARASSQTRQDASA